MFHALPCSPHRNSLQQRRRDALSCVAGSLRRLPGRCVLLPRRSSGMPRPLLLGARSGHHDVRLPAPLLSKGLDGDVVSLLARLEHADQNGSGTVQPRSEPRGQFPRREGETAQPIDRVESDCPAFAILTPPARMLRTGGRIQNHEYVADCEAIVSTAADRYRSEVCQHGASPDADMALLDRLSSLVGHQTPSPPSTTRWCLARSLSAASNSAWTTRSSAQ